jgi:hypothetical protein
MGLAGSGVAMHDLQNAVINTMANVEAVESIFIQPIGSILNIYTIIDADDDEVRDAIYDREAELLRVFENYHFDFNVIARRGRPIEQIGVFT